VSNLASNGRSRISFAVVGAVVGLIVGIIVSVTTDIPLAPEAGLLLGALVGWFSAARRPLPPGS